jgi:N-acetylmuramoyl-L-alanine amidase
MDAYRAIYHGDPADVHAPAAVNAVAELLAEQGRVLHDAQSLKAAVGQYEFLRKQYPGSSLRVQALLTEGEIEQNDLEDATAARERYRLLLKEHPKSEQAQEARAGLASLKTAGNREQGTGKNRDAKQGVSEAASRQASKATNQTVSEATTRPAIVTETTAKSDGSARSSLPAMEPTARQRTSLRVAAPVASPVSAPISTPDVELADVDAQTRPVASDVSAARGGQTAGGRALVTGIRHWSTATYTRVAIDLGSGVTYEAARVPNPDRIYFDLHGAKLAHELAGKSFSVTDDGFLKRVRAAQYSDDVTRVVLDVSDVTEYSAFLLPNPYRLIIDIHGGDIHGGRQGTANREQGTNQASEPAGRGSGATGRAANVPAPQMATVAAKPTAARPVPDAVATRSANATAEVADLSEMPDRVEATRKPTSRPISAVVADGTIAGDRGASDSASDSNTSARPAAGASTAPGSAKAKADAAHGRAVTAARPDTAPTNAGPAASGAGTGLASSASPASAATNPASARRTRRGRTVKAAAASSTTAADATPARAAAPMADGERSLVRALGLKIGRIVIDAGHGGHDSGTIGADGIEEKDVVLDVALRLGALLHDRLGAEIIYTRSDDTFIPLETRTAIANKAQADLFISIHANSSPDESARGVETYYLNFTSDATALDVAARENAVSDQSIHQLSDLVKKIALKDKIAESREFASDVEGSLYTGLTRGNAGLKDRGVKKAPFVVLIGANMPSILAEISFVTNPKDATQLRDPDYRERVAESLYKGVARYESGLSGGKPAPTERASVGN